MRKYVGGESYGDILTRELDEENGWIAFLRDEPGIRESAWTEAAALGKLIKRLHDDHRAVRIEASELAGSQG